MTTAENTKTFLRRRTVLAAAVSAIGLAGAAQAYSPAPAIVDVQVVDRDTGETARVWRHAGRLYVAGRPGARYSVRVTNNTPGRVLVVMSVDGVNILTGETAGYGQRGYVFSPYQSYDVSGWRKSDSEIAAFTFAPLSRSYAARTGRPHDVGVIGVAAFTERVEEAYAAAPAVSAQSRGRSASRSLDEVVVAESRAGRGSAAPAPPPPPTAARSAPSAQAMQRSERLGTGHGAREWSVVTNVPFERATTYPQQVRQIEYDSYANLVAGGVIPRARPAPGRPRPFPNGYVPDPPGGR